MDSISLLFYSQYDTTKLFRALEQSRLNYKIYMLRKTRKTLKDIQRELLENCTDSLTDKAI